jgi:hypothetical protein
LPASIGTAAGRPLLKQHGHEPVLETQLARADDAATQRVVLELPLALEHGVTDTGPAGQRLVERRDEAARGLDEQTIGV